MNKIEIAKRLHAFLITWLRATTPGMRALRVGSTGVVSVKDALGWRDVGHMNDWIPVARALGVMCD